MDAISQTDPQLPVGVPSSKQCATVALGEAPSVDNVDCWLPGDARLDAEQERVLTLLQEDTIPVKSYASVFIGRACFHTAERDDTTGNYISTMGTSHLKVDFEIMLRGLTADPEPQLSLQSRYGILTDILEMQGDHCVLLNVTWFKHEATFVHPLTKNVKVFKDYAFDPTSEPMVEACSITNQVVIVDLGPRPLDLEYRPQFTVLDREFVGAISRLKPA